jgi:hypothetical protein
MNPTPINRCINKELKYYGLKATGLIAGLCAMIIVWSKSSIVFGIIAGVIGYSIGDIASKHWQIGTIQRYSYWYLPTRLLFRNKSLPKSSDREFI